jgi:Tfp pilus assembly protein PilX
MSVCNGIAGVKDRCGRPLVMVNDERGMAFLTVVMVLLMLTVLGIAAITVSGLENNMAGLQRTMEASANAAESCLGTGANIIQQVFLPENGSQVPAVLLDNSSPPGPVPNGNKTVLQNELIGNPENNLDVPTGTGAAPNLVMTIGSYAVAGDIDRLYVKMRAGSGQQQFSAYEGTGVGAGSSGVDAYFRIGCVATNTATGTESRVSAIYACSLTGDGCQKQP